MPPGYIALPNDYHTSFKNKSMIQKCPKGSYCNAGVAHHAHQANMLLTLVCHYVMNVHLENFLIHRDQVIALSARKDTFVPLIQLPHVDVVSTIKGLMNVVNILNILSVAHSNFTALKAPPIASLLSLVITLLVKLTIFTIVKCNVKWEGNVSSEIELCAQAGDFKMKSAKVRAKCVCRACFQSHPDQK